MAAPRAAGGGFLKDVVAYVDVWSSTGTENYSTAFTTQLADMGAKVSKTFTKQVTHVVFKDGYRSTWDKAKARGVKLVSVLWVEKCRTAGTRVDEALFPAANTRERLPSLLRKKRKCMQPKDFVPKTPENDRRLQRKFERMTEELQRQKMTTGTDAPVLLFESPGSLVYSPPTAFHGHHNNAGRTLQEATGKRDDLPATERRDDLPATGQRHDLPATASPTAGQTRKNPGTSFCDAACDMSRDPLCSGAVAARRRCSPPDGLCGAPRRAQQEARRGGSASKDMGASSSSSGAMVDGARSPPPPASCDQPGPWEPRSPVPREGRSCRPDLPGAPASPDRAPAASPAQKTADEHRLSPAPSTEDPLLAGSRPSSSTKRKRAAGPRSPTEGRLKRGSCGPGPAPAPSREQPPVAWPASPGPNGGSASAAYEDYFSPDNLRERAWGPRPAPPRPRPPPAPLRCQSLSKRERRSILQRADFSCMGEKRSAVSSRSLIARALDQGDPAPSRGALQPPPALAGSPDRGGQAGPVQGGGSRPPRSEARPPPSSAAPALSPGPGQRPGEEAGEPTGTESTHEEGAPGQGDRRHGLGGDSSAENDANTEDKENVATGRSENVKNGPARCDFPDSPCAGFQDGVRPEKPKQSGRGAKPTRTLVMTSMPSEKQNVIVQVVRKLQGFSFSPEVCETTTHVLAGSPLRTLNVLLGIARGCWVLSYEWVLWSLELGHWISEEPFELSTHFPAAPVCRRERQLSPGQYRGALFADQPPMFIAPASSPPRAQLCELVRLCGGQVSPAAHGAGIVVGPHKGKRTASSKHLSEKWVLDSITQHKVCDFENYLLLQ